MFFKSLLTFLLSKRFTTNRRRFRRKAFRRVCRPTTRTTRARCSASRRRAGVALGVAAWAEAEAPLCWVAEAALRKPVCSHGARCRAFRKRRSSVRTSWNSWSKRSSRSRPRCRRRVPSPTLVSLNIARISWPHCHYWNWWSHNLCSAPVQPLFKS